MHLFLLISLICDHGTAPGPHPQTQVLFYVHPQGDLIQAHGFKYHLYPEDSPVFLTSLNLSPSHCPTAHSTPLLGCLIDAPDLTVRPSVSTLHSVFSVLVNASPSFKLLNTKHESHSLFAPAPHTPFRKPLRRFCGLMSDTCPESDHFRPPSPAQPWPKPPSFLAV